MATTLTEQNLFKKIVEMINQLVMNDELIEAKDLILRYIEKGGSAKFKTKLHLKLGEIFMKSERYEEAEKQYQFCMKENVKDPEIYYKSAYVNHYHLNNLGTAKEMYEICSKIAPTYTKCIFYYAKFYHYELNELQKAKELYLKCTASNNPEKACVFYHLAKLLIETNQDGNNNKSILYALRKAIQIQPDCAEYHHALASFLQNLGIYHQANYCYQQALDLTQISDDLIIENYIHFTTNCLQNENTFQYMKKICESSEGKYQYVWGTLTESKDDVIKATIYDYVVLFYDQNVNQQMHLNDQQIIHLFGGEDRIQELKQHFEEVTLKFERLCIILVASDHEYENVSRLLHISGLSISNVKIIKSISNDKVVDITKTKDDCKFGDHETCLFISNDPQSITNTVNECKTYFLTNSLSHYGLKQRDFRAIYEIISNHKMEENCEVAELLLNKLDTQLVDRIIKDCGRKQKCSDEIYTIITRKIKFNANYEKFFGFHNIVREAFDAVHQRKWWYASQLLEEALKFVDPSASVELLYRLAKCLSYLKQCAPAEKAYNQALAIDGNHYFVNFSYAMHNLTIDQPMKALKYFRKALGIEGFDHMAKSLSTGIARVYEKIGDSDQAEKFHKLSTNSIDNDMYVQGHYSYHLFLCKQRRYIEAREQLKICIQECPNSYDYNYQLGKVFLKLGKSTESQLNFDKARCIKQYEESDLNVYQHPQFTQISQFDEFWFDHVGKITNEFNQYYDNFKINQLDNVELLLNDRDIFKTLSLQINIDDQDDIIFIHNKLLEYKQLIAMNQNKF